jgi:hypothetical protein
MGNQSKKGMWLCCFVLMLDSFPMGTTKDYVKG